MKYVNIIVDFPFFACSLLLNCTSKSVLPVWFHHLASAPLYLLFCVLDNPVSMFSVVSMCGLNASIHLFIHSSHPYCKIHSEAAKLGDISKMVSFLSGQQVLLPLIVICMSTNEDNCVIRQLL